MDAHDLKRVNVRIKEIEKERDKVLKELNDIEKLKKKLEKDMVATRLKIDDLTLKARVKRKDLEKINQNLNVERKKVDLIKKDPVITDHATIQWMIREKGKEIKEVHEEMLTDKVRDFINTVGTGKIPNGDMTLVVENKVIVTAYKTQKRSKGK